MQTDRKLKWGSRHLISVVALCCAATSTSLLTACGGGGTTAEDALGKIKGGGQVSVAISGSAPTSFIDPSGNVAGIDPSVAEAAFKALGASKVNGVSVTFSSMIPGLQAKRFDAVAGGLFMNDKRCAQVAFSEPTVVMPFGMIYPKDAKAKPATLKGAADAGLRLVVQSGTYQEALAKEAGVSSSKLLSVTDLQAVVDTLNSGRADASIDLAPEAGEALKKAGVDGKYEIEAPDPALPVLGGGIAFRLEDTAVRDAFDVELKKLKDSGDFDKIVSENGGDPAPVRGVTRDQLCQNPG